MYFIRKFERNGFYFINKIFREMVTKGDVNSCRAGGGMLCRMLFIEFHRRRGLSEFSEITSAKYFDLAFVIILLQRCH